MCSTCGCGQPKNKHGEKTVADANQKYAIKRIVEIKKKKSKKA